jgi:glycerophosphoryl diester phosphodiesterase
LSNSSSGFQSIATGWKGNLPMLVLCHRGYHADVPENTLASFEAAIALGVDGIETDIRLTADQALVLFHDHLTRDGREVARVTHRELSAAAGYPVATLDEALQLPRDRQAPFLWNLEIKAPAAADPMLALLERYRARWRFLITSFCHPIIDTVSRRLDVDCGLLLAHRPLDFQARPDWIPRSPRVGTLVWYSETVDAGVLDQTRRCGLRNFVYGATTPDEHRRLAALAVDGIITDRPEFLIPPEHGTVAGESES